MARTRRHEMEEMNDNPFRFLEPEVSSSASGASGDDDDVEALELGDFRKASREGRLSDRDLFGRMD